MSFEADIGFTIIAGGRIWMFCAIKHKNISTDRHGSNDIRILRLISRTINFSFMHNLLSNRNATVKASISSEFYASTWTTLLKRCCRGCTSTVIIVILEFNTGDGELDIGDLEVILVCSRGMCSDQESMCRVVFAWFTFTTSENAHFSG